MEIHAKGSTFIRPAEETPKHRLWLSNLDLYIIRGHVPTVHFYPFSSDFNELCSKLKQDLSKVLVAFYPLAGRLAKDENGKLEIDCNGEGVLFIEAQTTCVLDDLGDFSPSFKLSQLVPKLDTSTDISAYPLFIVQVTSFKCGGVCLGIGLDHKIADGTSVGHFINSWAEVSRGLPISIPPFFDRTILHAMTPSFPTFDHPEYHLPTSKKTNEVKLSSIPTSTSFARLTIPVDQINILKAKIRKDHDNKFTTYEILAAHIRRCVCRARALPNDQLVRLYIPIDGRLRFDPPLPPGYFGNVIFYTAVIALAGDIQSEPLIFTVKKIHEALKRRDDEYLRSALAYLETNPEVTNFNRGHSFEYPNVRIVSWTRMPMSDADFGWGRPMYVSRAIITFQGEIYMLPTPCMDKSLPLILCLETHELELFKKLIYDV